MYVYTPTPTPARPFGSETRPYRTRLAPKTLTTEQPKDGATGGITPNQSTIVPRESPVQLGRPLLGAPGLGPHPYPQAACGVCPSTTCSSQKMSPCLISPGEHHTTPTNTASLLPHAVDTPFNPTPPILAVRKVPTATVQWPHCQKKKVSWRQHQLPTELPTACPTPEACVGHLAAKNMPSWWSAPNHAFHPTSFVALPLVGR